MTVSSGDSGSASCDGDTAKVSTIARLGLSVSGYASTPYNIAVGGTDFYGLGKLIFDLREHLPGTAGAPTYYRTAKSYIPESIWNDSTQQDNQPLADNVPNGTGKIRKHRCRQWRREQLCHRQQRHLCRLPAAFVADGRRYTGGSAGGRKPRTRAPCRMCRSCQATATTTQHG